MEYLMDHYRDWSDFLVIHLHRLGLLDDIERISVFLRCMPESTTLKEMAEAIDPAHTYKTKVRTESGAWTCLNRIMIKFRTDGTEYYISNRKGVKVTNEEIRLNIMAHLYLLALDSREYFEHKDWSEQWEEGLDMYREHFPYS